MTTTAKKTNPINLSDLFEENILVVTIRGEKPLIVNRFPRKAKEMILAKQMGTARKTKQLRDPESDFLDSIHFIGRRAKDVDDLLSPDIRFGFPAVSFKNAMLRMAKEDGVPMTDGRTMYFIEPDAGDGELIEIIADQPPVMRSDTVRISVSTTDLRFRAEFPAWHATLRIRFRQGPTTAEQLLKWLHAAGHYNGVGEWRVAGRQSTGTYGTFNIEEAKIG